MKKYEDVVCTLLEEELNPLAEKHGVKYDLKYNVAKDELTCIVENTKDANDFSYYALDLLKTKHKSVRFEFPDEIIKEN